MEQLAWSGTCKGAGSGSLRPGVTRPASPPPAPPCPLPCRSPILERDEAHGGTIWNTAVVVGSNGGVIGKHRKNHITRVGDFNESTYYMVGAWVVVVVGGTVTEMCSWRVVALSPACAARPAGGQHGAPGVRDGVWQDCGQHLLRQVGDSAASQPRGRRGAARRGPPSMPWAVGIPPPPPRPPCRHIPLNCQAFGLNGAEVVFNPCATVEGFTEPMWGVEARYAAIANRCAGPLLPAAAGRRSQRASAVLAPPLCRTAEHTPVPASWLAGCSQPTLLVPPPRLPPAATTCVPSTVWAPKSTPHPSPAATASRRTGWAAAAAVAVAWCSGGCGHGGAAQQPGAFTPTLKQLRGVSAACRSRPGATLPLLLLLLALGVRRT